MNWDEVHMERKSLAGTSHMFERFGKRSNYNDNGIRLLSVFDALEKGNERARVINHQYKAKCGFRGPSQKHMEGQSAPAAREHRMLSVSPRS